MRLGEMLVSEKLVSAAALEEAVEAQVVHGGRLGTNLVELGLLAERDLARILGKQHNVAFASGEMTPDPRAMALVDASFADDNDLLPMRLDATRVHVATINPHDLKVLDAIGFKSGKRVVPVVVPEFRMNQLLRKYCKAFRNIRPIDMNSLRPSKTLAAQKDERGPKGADLMSEDEFQSLYAQAMGESASADSGDDEEVIEGTALTGETPVAIDPRMLPAFPPAATPAGGVPGVRPATALGLSATQMTPARGVPQLQRPTLAPPVQAPAPGPIANAPPPAPGEPGFVERRKVPRATSEVPATPLSFPEAQRMLQTSEDREDVAKTVLRFALGKWKRALVLNVQGDLVTGWHGVGQGIREKAVRRIGIAIRGQSTFKLVRDTRSHYVGPMKRDAGTAVFYKLLGGGYPTTAVLLPLLVRGKMVHILYVDNGPDALTPPDIGELLILSQSVARSYEAMMRRRKSS